MHILVFSTITEEEFPTNHMEMIYGVMKNNIKVLVLSTPDRKIYPIEEIEWIYSVVSKIHASLERYLICRRANRKQKQASRCLETVHEQVLS